MKYSTTEIQAYRRGYVERISNLSPQRLKEEYTQQLKQHGAGYDRTFELEQLTMLLKATNEDKNNQ